MSEARRTSPHSCGHRGGSRTAYPVSSMALQWGPAGEVIRDATMASAPVCCQLLHQSFLWLRSLGPEPSIVLDLRHDLNSTKPGPGFMPSLVPDDRDPHVGDDAGTAYRRRDFPGRRRARIAERVHLLERECRNRAKTGRQKQDSGSLSPIPVGLEIPQANARAERQTEQNRQRLRRNAHGG